MGFFQRLATLILAAKIEGALDAELPQHGDVGGCEVAEMVGAKQLAPSHRAAVLADITAQIAEIGGAFEIEMADRNICH